MGTTKIIFVLYEGKHDAAILTRLLRENSYREFKDKKIKEFPAKLKGYFQSKINDFTYEDETNIFQKPQLPNHVCKSREADHWFVFYEMGGDSKIEFVKSIVSELKVSDSSFEGDERFETEAPVSIVFFFDADNSIDLRKKKFKHSYEDVLPSFTQQVESVVGHKYGMADVDGFHAIGLFIYGRADQTGTLEDILIPLMQNGNEPLFQDADVYLEKYMSVADKENPSKKGKALINVVGQPKHHGKANQVIISDTNLINNEKFSSNDVFTDILTFMLGFTR